MYLCSQVPSVYSAICSIHRKTKNINCYIELGSKVAYKNTLVFSNDHYYATIVPHHIKQKKGLNVTSRIPQRFSPYNFSRLWFNKAVLWWSRTYIFLRPSWWYILIYWRYDTSFAIHRANWESAVFRNAWFLKILFKIVIRIICWLRLYFTKKSKTNYSYIL